MGDKGSFILKMKEFMQKVATFFKTPMMRSVLNIRTVYFLLLPLILLLALSVMHLTNGNAAYMFFASPFWGLKFLISYLFLLAFQCFFSVDTIVWIVFIPCWVRWYIVFRGMHFP